MPYDPESVELRNCQFVHDRNCRRSNYVAGSYAETSNSRAAALGLWQVVHNTAKSQREAIAIFSEQSLCPLCLCGEHVVHTMQPQRHREHRDCTETAASF